MGGIGRRTRELNAFPALKGGVSNPEEFQLEMFEAALNSRLLLGDAAAGLQEGHERECFASSL